MTEISGPNRLAAVLAAKITEIESPRAIADTQQERRDLNRLVHHNRELLRWCRTRTGYRTGTVAATVCDVTARDHEA